MTAPGLFDLSGQVCVVTGAGSGLGAAIAAGLAAHGAVVLAWDLDSGAAEECAAGVRERGGSAFAYACDVTSREQVDAATAEAEQLGGVDVLVTSAGIGARSPAETMTQQQWDRVLDVNLNGTWACNQAIGASMIRRGCRGRIINVASIAALVGVTTGNANYAASKGGVVSLMRTLAVEWAPHGLRVNALAPTHFRTPLIEAALEADPGLMSYFTGNIPLGRLGEPREIVGPTVFLASEASSMVTGHVLVVDGGHTAQ